MEYDLSVTIRRPPERVFAFLEDVQDDAAGPGSPVAEMEKIPPGPTGVGTRWREVVRVAPLVRWTIWSEVTAFEPGRVLEETFRGPFMSGWIRYEVEPAGGGTVLRQLETYSPRGPMRLLGARLGRMLGSRIEARLKAIRDGLESETAGDLR